MNQGIDINGIGVSVSWPPAISTSGTWQSWPIYDNVTGSTFNNLIVGWSAFSCAFSEVGDVYKGNHVYRPSTYIKFSYFS